MDEVPTCGQQREQSMLQNGQPLTYTSVQRNGTRSVVELLKTERRKEAHLAHGIPSTE